MLTRTPPPAAEISESDRYALLARHGRFALAYSVACQPGLAHFGDAEGFLSYLHGRPHGLRACRSARPGRNARRTDRRFRRREGRRHLLAGVPRDRRAPRRARLRRQRAGGREHRRPCGLRFFRPRPAQLPHRDEPLRAHRPPGRRGAAGKLRSRPGQVDFGGVAPDKDDPPARIGLPGPSRRSVRRAGRPQVLHRRFARRSGGLRLLRPALRGRPSIGYLSATRRWLPDADPLSAYFMVSRAIERFREEGADRLHLGLMPFHRIEDDEFTKDWLTRRVFRLIYTNRLANWLIYPSQTLARHKESYGGTTRQTYCAQNTPLRCRTFSNSCGPAGSSEHRRPRSVRVSRRILRRPARRSGSSGPRRAPSWFAPTSCRAP